jgi:hypothetical protein
VKFTELLEKEGYSVERKTVREVAYVAKKTTTEEPAGGDDNTKGGGGGLEP